MLSTLTPTSAQSSAEPSLTMSGTVPVCIVAPEEFPIGDISELPPPQAASAAAAATQATYLSIVSFMTFPPLDIP